MNRIHRTYPDKDFTLLNNAVFKSGLSARAMGVLCFIMSLPRDWVLHKNWIYQKLPEGRDAINTAWKELEDKGFIVCKKSTGQGRGKLPETSYYVSDLPGENGGFSDAENTDSKIPVPETRAPKNRASKTRQLQSTIEQSTNNKSPLISNEIKVPPAKKQKVASKKSTGEPKEKTHYQKFIDIYDRWFKDRNGVPPKYDKGNGEAAKTLIKYFGSIATDRAKRDGIAFDDAYIEGKALEGWQYVLNSWGKLDNFLQSKTRLLDINSNIQNIISIIKNGNSKTGQPSGKPATGGQVSTASLAGAIANHYRGAGGTPPGTGATPGE